MDRIEIDGHRGIYHVGPIFNLQTALAAIDRAVETEGFLDCSSYLWDFSNTVLDLNVQELKALGRAYRERVPAPTRRRKIALVAHTPAARSTLMIIRSLLLRSDRVECQIFDRPGAASVWLAARAQWTGKFDVLNAKALLQAQYPVADQA
ncbi:MAG: hypothetical protein AAGE01_17170 [Pseudomonadota bacterium]